jgi:uncharacterized protein with HEPN domain
MNKDQEIILDLIRACELSVQFCENMDWQTFSQDLKTQSSVLYQIVIIGEAVNRLSSNFITNNPQIPIRQIRGMRNRVVHEYKEVDLQILWEAIQKDIPELLNLLKNQFC